MDIRTLLKEDPRSEGEYDPHRFREVEIALGEGHLRLLEVRSAPEGEHWARVWPSGIALARWLGGQRIEGPILELGAGLGVVSVALARRGLHALATDLDPIALLLAAHNAARNGVAIGTELLDWSRPCTRRSAFVVGADLVYEPEAPELLFDLLHARDVLAPGGTLVLAGPRRRHRGLDRLIERLASAGYAHRREELATEWEGAEFEVSLHSFVRPRSPDRDP